MVEVKSERRKKRSLRDEEEVKARDRNDGAEVEALVMIVCVRRHVLTSDTPLRKDDIAEFDPFR